MDTNFCSLAFGIDDYILPSKRAEWTEKRSKDCRDDFREDAKNNFSPILAALNLRNMTRENHNYSRRSSELSKCHACVVKPIAVTLVKVKIVSLAVKD